MNDSLPSDPVGMGAASFLNAFAGQYSKAQDRKAAEREKAAASDQRENNKKDFDLWHQSHIASRGSQISPADKHFFQTFAAAGKAYQNLLSRYLNPNPLNDPQLYTSMKGLTPEQRHAAADAAFQQQHQNDTYYDLVLNPATRQDNLSHYQKLMGLGMGKPVPAGGPPAPMPAPQPAPVSSSPAMPSPADTGLSLTVPGNAPGNF